MTTNRRQPDNAGSGRTSQGRFRPGQSGNPGGGRLGSRHRVARAFDELGAAEANDIINRLLKLARGGDMQAIALVLPRIWPVRKGRPIKLQMPVIQSAEDVLNAHVALVEAVGAGVVTAEEAQAVGAVLAGMVRAIEIVDLDARIAALEQARPDDRTL